MIASQKHTETQYREIISSCRDLFHQKMKDYGVSWRIFRLTALTDQLFIKAQRLRQTQELQCRKIDESDQESFIAIVNYAVIALIQFKKGMVDHVDLNSEQALELYDEVIEQAFILMQNKNHDYGEAWRQMRISSMTDLILQKLLRIKQIEENKGKTLISEGVDANYMDILNYAVFSLIKITHT